ncbi:MAG: hypothetical protein AAGF12_00045 [Myxococcota bacterium]
MSVQTEPASDAVADLEPLVRALWTGNHHVLNAATKVPGDLGVVASCGAALQGDPAGAPGIEALSRMHEPAAVLVAADLMARRHLWTLDLELAQRVMDVGRPHDNADIAASFRVSFRVTEAWIACFSGEYGAAMARADASFREASEHRAAHSVVESTAVRALAALGLHAHEEALGLARRASRMAQTEALPLCSYLANVVLARARRLLGGPFLATRILSALREQVPATLRPWVDWELTLSHGSAVGAMGRAASLHRALEAATIPEPPLESQEQETPAPIAQDLERVRAILDVYAPRADDAIGAFLEGRVDTPPFGLEGLCSRYPADIARAYVLIAPERRATRVLAVSASAHSGPGVTRMERPTRKGRRTDHAIAVLALAEGASLELLSLFRQCYEFPYVAARHANMLRVLLHRMRDRVRDVAEIRRDNDRLTLVPAASFLLPDPRCTQAVGDRALQLMARERGLSARRIATELGVPLRSAQTMLEGLVDGGACARERRGNRIEYIVEDTTFHEPTGWQ